MKKALLFDIDGTLLRVKGLGTLAYKATFKEILGHDIVMDNINWMGATDGSVLRHLLIKENYDLEQIDILIPQIFERYIQHFNRITTENPDKVLAIPHVKHLLNNIHDQALGILTGNIQGTAYIKLQRAGLEHYFPPGVGGFASDSDIREDLYPIAMQRMSEHYDREFRDALIIGDSPRDIDVARAHGIPCIIMATGRMSYEELSVFHPDYLFRGFDSWPEIIKIIHS